ncbi:MAG: AraC family transcriptional regulator [Ruminococcaceae bacterium]|nr:AraC family transcriptional regulator [Oscillospiraceae bacterium]
MNQISRTHALYYKNMSISSQELIFDRPRECFSLVNRDNGWLTDRRQIICFLPHIHEAAEVIYINEGEMTVVYGSERCRVKTGELLIFDPYQLHGAMLDVDQPNVRYTFATFEPAGFMPIGMTDAGWEYSLADWAGEKLICDTVIADSERTREIGALVCSLAELYACQGSSGVAELRLSAAIQTIFALLAEGGYLHQHNVEKSNDFLRDMTAFLEENYAKRITAEQISERFPYSHSYFCRLFKGHFGKPFSRYLIEYRIQRALSDYMNSGGDPLPIGEIAERVGFTDFCWFSREFKKYTTLSPTEYLQLRRRSELMPSKPFER